jgi:hypothetical protein
VTAAHDTSSGREDQCRARRRLASPTTTSGSNAQLHRSPRSARHAHPSSPPPSSIGAVAPVPSPSSSVGAESSDPAPVPSSEPALPLPSPL